MMLSPFFAPRKPESGTRARTGTKIPPRPTPSRAPRVGSPFSDCSGGTREWLRSLASAPPGLVTRRSLAVLYLYNSHASCGKSHPARSLVNVSTLFQNAYINYSKSLKKRSARGVGKSRFFYEKKTCVLPI